MEENRAFVIRDGDSYERKQCLLGKFLTRFEPSKQEMEDFVSREWKLKKKVTVLPKSNGHWVFEFEDEIDKEWVMGYEFGPRTMSNKMLVLQRWDEKEPEISRGFQFQNVPIWIQLLDVPWNRINRPVVCKVAEFVGRILQVGIFEERPYLTDIPGVRVAINPEKMLPSKIVVRFDDGEEFAVTIAYQTTLFCLICGHLGHQEDACDKDGPTVLRAVKKMFDDTSTSTDWCLKIENNRRMYTIRNIASKDYKEFVCGFFVVEPGTRGNRSDDEKEDASKKSLRRFKREKQQNICRERKELEAEAKNGNGEGSGKNTRRLMDTQQPNLVQEFSAERFLILLQRIIQGKEAANERPPRAP